MVVNIMFFKKKMLYVPIPMENNYIHETQMSANDAGRMGWQPFFLLHNPEILFRLVVVSTYT